MTIKYRVEHEFIYGWDDAGWHDGVTGEPTLYDTYQDALADLEDFIYNENIAFDEGDIEDKYERNEFRIVEVV